MLKRCSATCGGMEFNTLTKRIAKAGRRGFRRRSPNRSVPATKRSRRPRMASRPLEASPLESASPQQPWPPAAALARAAPIDRSQYETVTTRERLEKWIAGAQGPRRLRHGDHRSRRRCRPSLVGLSLAVAPGQACYVPLAHTGPEAICSAARNRPPAAAIAEALGPSRPLLEEPSILKIGHNIKYDRW